MRIALVAPLVSAIAQPYLGGAQALLADLAQGLMKRGHRVTLFARDDSLVPGIDIEPVAVPDDVQPANFSEAMQVRPADTSFFARQISFSIFFSSCSGAAPNLT
jgi:UDP-glucose:tetrahydrobiopterin glucosyltransferase